MSHITGSAGINLIKGCESLALKAYKCPAGVWTIGWGDTGADVVEGLVITEADAEARLARKLRYFEGVVNGAVQVPITQNQFDALVSLCYNIGPGDPKRDVDGFRTSTVLRRLNAGDVPGAASAFEMWVRAGGKVSNGLKARRKAEAELFLSGK